jgi:outer membrane protein
MSDVIRDGQGTGVGRDVRRVLALGLLWTMCHGTAMAAASDMLDQALLNAFRNSPYLIAQCALAAATDATTPQMLDGDDQATYRIRLAEASAAAAGEALRMTEQTILLNAATAYVDLLRDGAVLELRRRNFEVVAESLRLTRERFDVGEAARTDVTQGETLLSSVRDMVARAEAQYARSQVAYSRVIGVAAGKLAPAPPADRLIPGRLVEAIEVRRAHHPDVGGAASSVEAALLQAKIHEASPNRGEAEESSIGQAQRTLAQRRMELDTARDRTQANIVAVWGQLDTVKSRIPAAQARVAASEIGLDGQREKAKSGERSTLGVLDAQQNLVEARVALVTAQHDRVVASFALLSAVGELNLRKFGIDCRSMVR